jgi:hypothetical protein
MLQEGRNDILIKLASSDEKRVYFRLGLEDDLAPEEFNNDLPELVDGFPELFARGQTDDAPQIVTLTYANSNASSVSVIGTFNAWSPVDTNMRKGRGGEWEISLHLTPGRYAYRFLIDSSEQILDPRCPDQEADGYGGMNSVLFVR